MAVKHSMQWFRHTCCSIHDFCSHILYHGHTHSQTLSKNKYKRYVTGLFDWSPCSVFLVQIRKIHSVVSGGNSFLLSQRHRQNNSMNNKSNQEIEQDYTSCMLKNDIGNGTK